MSDILTRLELLRREGEAALQSAGNSKQLQQWHTEFLGRKGRLTVTLKNLSNLSSAERPVIGKLANEIKKRFEQAYGVRQASVEHLEIEAAMQRSVVDVTMPGRPQAVGKAHPTSATLREIYDIFAQLGFQVYDSAEVETDEYNFGLLNMPPGHPARDMWDTFYTTTPGVILR